MYNGFGVEVDKMIQNYYGQRIKVIEVNKLIPTAPKDGDIVGIRIVYDLFMDRDFEVSYKYIVFITDVMSIHVSPFNEERRYVSSLDYSDFMDLRLEHSFAYAYHPFELNQRLDIIDQGLNSLFAKESIVKVKQNISYQQLIKNYNDRQSLKQTTKGLVDLILMILLSCIDCDYLCK